MLASSIRSLWLLKKTDRIIILVDTLVEDWPRNQYKEQVIIKINRQSEKGNLTDVLP